ncbi:MAG: radical SAM protein, partial [Polyangia bacterium]|nr:radical SAM protein [Polyangia bacterium]
VLLGLAGRAGSASHAEATGRLLSRIGPAYASALSIMVPEEPHTPEATLRAVPEDSPWYELEPLELVAELRTLVEHLHCADTTFRSNHASNFLPIGGRLPHDRAAMLSLIDTVLSTGREDLLRPSWMRGL